METQEWHGAGCSEDDAEGSIVDMDLFGDWNLGDSGATISKSGSAIIPSPTIDALQASDAQEPLFYISNGEANAIFPQVANEVVYEDDSEDDHANISMLIKELLEHASAMAPVKRAFESILIPEVGFETLASVLQKLSVAGRLSSDGCLNEAVAIMLHDLAQGNYFQTLVHPASSIIGRHEPVPSLQPPASNTRKRKREALERDQSALQNATRDPNILQSVQEAIQEALKAFQSNVIDKQLIATLRQVFLFAVTSASGPSITPEKKKTINQISKLIQLLGILSGAPISVGEPLAMLRVPVDESCETIDAGDASEDTTRCLLKKKNICASVFPCPHTECFKTFSKLYDLRIHQRVHANKRPFKCPSCPATFTRSHDLRRHAQGHTAKVFQCTICKHTFSRRDAFKRHKQTGKNMELCGKAECQVIEADGRKKANRWSANGRSEPSSSPEDGELAPQDPSSVIDEMSQLHQLLHTTVAEILSQQRNVAEPVSNDNISQINELAQPITDSTAAAEIAFSMQDDMYSSLAAIFPDINFSSPRFDLNQLLGIHDLIHEVNAETLTAVEFEASLAEPCGFSANFFGNI